MRQNEFLAIWKWVLENLENEFRQKNEFREFRGKRVSAKMFKRKACTCQVTHQIFNNTTIEELITCKLGAFLLLTKPNYHVGQENSERQMSAGNVQNMQGGRSRAFTAGVFFRNQLKKLSFSEISRLYILLKITYETKTRAMKICMRQNACKSEIKNTS